MSTPTTPDYRIKFPPATIDFDIEVGETGQDHDSYPSANSQLRFDWMRIYLIGLLSHQASYLEPIQHREGSFWYDLNGPQMKVFKDGTWAPIADIINVAAVGTEIATLAEFYTRFKELETRVAVLEGR